MPHQSLMSEFVPGALSGAAVYFMGKAIEYALTISPARRAAETAKEQRLDNTALALMERMQRRIDGLEGRVEFLEKEHLADVDTIADLRAQVRELEAEKAELTQAKENGERDCGERILDLNERIAALEAEVRRLGGAAV